MKILCSKTTLLSSSLVNLVIENMSVEGPGFRVFDFTVSKLSGHKRNISQIHKKVLKRFHSCNLGFNNLSESHNVSPKDRREG